MTKAEHLQPGQQPDDGMQEPTAPDTLADALAEHAVGEEELRRRYGPFLVAINRAIAVMPNLYRYLPIHDVTISERRWLGGTRESHVCLPADALNAIVPASLDLPAGLLPWNRMKHYLAFAKISGSLGAKCNYCLIHDACYMGLRGVDALKIHLAGKRHTHPQDAKNVFTPSEQIILDIGEALGKIPCEMTPELTDRLEQMRSGMRRVFNDREIEMLSWVWMLMGYLNRMTDGVKVPIEQSLLTTTARAIAGTEGWWTPGKHAPKWEGLGEDEGTEWSPARDTFLAFLGLLPVAPALVRKSGHLVKGVPTRTRPLEMWLEQRTGYPWPEIALRRLKRPKRAAAAMVAANCDPRRTVLGLVAKARAGRVFAEEIGDPWLAHVTKLAEENAWRVEQVQGPEYWQRIQGHARRTVQGMEPVETRERPFRADHSDAAMRMARAWATTPADPGGAVIAELKQDLTPAQLIEGMHNLAVLMAMHRFGAFWHAKEMAEEKGAG